MKCWSCCTELPDPEWGKLSFKASCDACGVDLHCCKNCHFYRPGKPNDCEVPGTEWISDRAKANLCEEFKLKTEKKTTAEISKDSVLKRLFGEEESPSSSPKQKFDSLFKDD